MASICPTVTAEEPDSFKKQMELISRFAVRVHIDLSDADFTGRKLIDADKVWWPGGMRADLHIMMQRPFEHAEVYRALQPQLVIIHAEGQGDFVSFADYMHQHGIEVGVALLQETPADAIMGALDAIDHVLIFSGHLGHFGGQADLGLLDKVRQLKQLKPSLEIGWDGGINEQNARALKDGGVDVLNVGGFIQRSQHPEQAYDSLRRLVL